MACASQYVQERCLNATRRDKGREERDLIKHFCLFLSKKALLTVNSDLSGSLLSVSISGKITGITSAAIQGLG